MVQKRFWTSHSSDFLISFRPYLFFASFLSALFCSSSFAQSEFRLRDICHLKGQEENVLQGLGLVVGLKGTGDGEVKPMMRALARSMQLMGGQVASDLQGRINEKDMPQAKNVALVFITATVPPAGAQPGDKLNCTVSAINAKSIEGGMLMLTPLLGPRVDRPTVYALAQGAVMLENPKLTTNGVIPGGCKMEAAVQTEYLSGDLITLVLEPSHSSFDMAQQVEDTINDFARSGLNSRSAQSPGNSSSSANRDTAVAIDQTHVVVRVPENYRSRPVQFISLIQDLPLVNQKNNKRVVIRQREGVIVIGEDVTISPVAISHKNLTISTKSSGGGSASFAGLNYNRNGPPGERTTLKQLVDALNVLAVPTEDMISIIKAIDRQGTLYGELVIE